MEEDPPPSQPRAGLPGGVEERERRDGPVDGRPMPSELGREEGGPAEVVDEKRVSNKKIKAELNARLLFPSYREGLAAIASGNTTPFADYALPLLRS